MLLTGMRNKGENDNRTKMRDEIPSTAYITRYAVSRSLPLLSVLLGIILIIFSIMQYHVSIYLLLIIIGSILTVTGIVAGILTYRLSRLLNEQETLRAVITDSIEAEKSTSLSGVKRVHRNQSKVLVNYESIIRQTKDHVDILGTTLTSILRNPDFESSTFDALNRGIRFRVLILDPRSVAVNFQSRQEDRTIESVKIEIESSIQNWRKFQEKVSSSHALEIRTYDDIPSSFLMITDMRVFFSPYLYSISLRNSPCFEVIANAGPLYEAYRYHFKKIWEQANPVSDSV